MTKGYVYILTNPAMPGLVKIGKTTRDIDQRIKELSGSTGVPTPFQYFDYQFSPDCDVLELRMHEAFAEERVSGNREFFNIDKSTAANKLYDEHRRIISDFVEEFASDLIVSYEPMTVSDISVYTVSDRIGASPYDVAAALACVQGDELHPALRRVSELRRGRAQEHQPAHLKVVGEE